MLYVLENNLLMRKKMFPFFIAILEQKQASLLLVQKNFLKKETLLNIQKASFPIWKESFLVSKANLLF
jgi:hypothetical protein